jgi:hypothetical protein
MLNETLTEQDSKIVTQFINNLEDSTIELAKEYVSILNPQDGEALFTLLQLQTKYGKRNVNYISNQIEGLRKALNVNYISLQIELQTQLDK